MGSMITTPNQRSRYSKTKARKSLESLKEKEFNRIQTKMESPDHIYGSLPTRHYQTTLDWGTHQGGDVYTYNKKPKSEYRLKKMAEPEEMKKPSEVPQRHGPPRYRRADGRLMTYPESLELHDWNDRKLRN